MFLLMNEFPDTEQVVIMVCFL